MVFHSPIPSLPMCLLSLSPKRQQTGQVLFGVAAHRTAADDVLGLADRFQLLHRSAVLGCGPGVLKKADPCPSGMENQMKKYRTHLRLDLKNCSIDVKVAELTRSFQWLGGSMPIFVSINEDYHRIIYNPKHQPVQVVTKVWLFADPLLNWVDVWISLCKPIQSHKGCNPSRMVNGWLLSGPVVGK